MSIYLEDHLPARSQFRTERRTPSWHPDAPIVTAIVVHTAENMLDTMGVDTGAENVARFIVGRSEPGSYHTIVDSDSTVQLGRYEWEMFGEGTGGNRWALHLAFAMRAEDWPTHDAKINTGSWWWEALRLAAREASDMCRWVADNYGIWIPTERITRDEYHRGESGFVGHGELDPGRRSDPGDRFPWGLFLSMVVDPLHQPNGDSDVREIELWQQDLVDAGFALGDTGPNRDGVDDKFGAHTLVASRSALAKLAACKQDLRHDFTPEDAVIGRATRSWLQAIKTALED